MINRLTLKFGNAPDTAPLSLMPGHATVFVGPNNSGKTLVLNEMHSLIARNRKQHGALFILEELWVEPFSTEQAWAMLDPLPSGRSEPAVRHGGRSSECLVQESVQ